MSSAPIPVAAASAPPASATHWCHECEMNITLSSSDLHCPHCRSLFLQHLVAPSNQPISISSDSDDDYSFHDYHHIAPPTNPNPNPSYPNSSSRNPTNPTPTAYLQLLIQHLTGDDDPISPSLLPLNRRRPRGPSPASKSCIESIPTVEISDPTLVCAICKDDFFIGSSARKLPCSHVYHSDCIVPWISSHNSCPLCRFRLPREEGHEGGRRGMPRSFTFGRRNVGRNSWPQRMLLPEWERVTATQMAEMEGNIGPTNSGETVSSEQPPAAADGGDSAVAGSGVQDRMEE